MVIGTNSPSSAVLIVDASALITLALPVPLNIQTEHNSWNEKKLFVDILLELPNVKHAVVIPEMVAFEAAYMLSNYRTATGLFRNSRYDDAALHSWLRRHSDDVPIVPLPPQSTSVASQLMLQARSAMKIKDPFASRYILMDIDKTRKLCPGLGEDAAIELGHLYGANQKIYFVTCDADAACKATLAGLMPLSTQQLVYSLMVTGLLSRAGIATDTMKDMKHVLGSGQKQVMSLARDVRHHGAQEQLIENIKARIRSTPPIAPIATDQAPSTAAQRPFRDSGKDRFAKRHGSSTPGSGSN